GQQSSAGGRLVRLYVCRRRERRRVARSRDVHAGVVRCLRFGNAALELVTRLLRRGPPRFHGARHLTLLEIDGLACGVDSLLDTTARLLELVSHAGGNV